MPLVTLTTKPAFHPATSFEHSLSTAQRVIDLAFDLPDFFCDNAASLHLEPTLPQAAVQVSHRAAHQLDVHAPDLWVVVVFSRTDLDEEAKGEATGFLKAWLVEWSKGFLPATARPTMALDCYWNESRGFIQTQGLWSDW